MLPFTALLSGTELLTTWWNGLRTASPSTGATLSSSSSGSTAPTTGSKAGVLALREIAARYDVTKITPSEFAQMLQQIEQTGALSEADRQLLAQILVDLHQEGIAPNETIDLVRFYTKKVEKFRDSLENRSFPPAGHRHLEAMLAAMEKRLDWLRRFALVHTHPEGASLNLLS